MEQQAGGKKRDMDVEAAEELADCLHVAVEKRLAAGENDVTNAEVLHGLAMTFEGFRGELFAVGALPDVAHDAAAVAERVRVEDQDGQLCEDARARKRAIRLRRCRHYLVEQHRTSSSAK